MERSGNMLVLGTGFLQRHRLGVAMSEDRINVTPVQPVAGCSTARHARRSHAPLFRLNR